MENILEVKSLGKRYASSGTGVVEVFHDITFDVKAGEIVALTGPSGSGKSTLLNLIGTLDLPSSGEIIIEGEDTSVLTSAELASFRNKKIGFIFQFHHLLPEFTAIENIGMPALIAGKTLQGASKRAEELLAEVGLLDRKTHRPSELSGGEAQRVAVARSFMMQPALILADEPTGNLDNENSDKLFELMLALAAKFNQTFIIATHNTELAKRAQRHFHLEKGILQEY
ncbi:MAG: ABC transporter ATP-binding protein [Bacteroidota bacterium]|nr:ABC transporter ATP-binding protein [Bacteroidota bacterium]